MLDADTHLDFSVLEALDFSESRACESEHHVKDWRYHKGDAAYLVTMICWCCEDDRGISTLRCARFVHAVWDCGGFVCGQCGENQDLDDPAVTFTAVALPTTG